MTTPKFQQTTALALLFGSILLIFGAFILPIASIFTERWDSIAEAERRLASLGARRKDAGSLAARRQTLEREFTNLSWLIPARSEAEAQQVFQQLSRAVLAAQKVDLGGMRSLPIVREGDLVALRLETSMRVPVEIATVFVAAIEGSQQSIFFERVQFRRGSGADIDILTVSATLRAYAMLEQPSKATQ